jgi:hypothetical protein
MAKTNLDVALQYIKRGQRVFPCRQDKSPYTSNGFHDATLDEGKVRRWWRKYPTALVGGPTGELIIVIDGDKRPERGIDYERGIESLGAELPSTTVVLTPSGGCHWYYKCSEHVQIPCSVQKIGEGLDVRGFGGYVILGGSMLENGKAYEFEASSTSLAPMPDWLIAKCMATPIQRERPDYDGLPIDAEIIREILSHLDPAMSYTDWIRVGMALHHWDLDAGLELWDQWSEKANNYPGPGNLDYHWHSFNKGHEQPITVGSLVNMAKQCGFSFLDVPVTFSDRDSPPEPSTPKHSHFFEMAHELTELIQPPEYLIDELIEYQTTGGIFGARSTFKSIVAMDMAFCIAAGLCYHGREVKQGLVVYLAGEGASGLGRRFRALEHRYDHDGRVPLAVYRMGMNLSEESNVLKLAQQIRLLEAEVGERVVAVFIDTRARHFGGEENSNDDMGTYVRHMDYLRETFQSTVINVHHTGFQSPKRSRGASSWEAALDWEFRIDRATEDQMFIEMINSKPPKDGALIVPQHLEIGLREVGIVDAKGRVVHSPVVESMCPSSAFIEEADEADSGLTEGQKNAMTDHRMLSRSQAKRAGKEAGVPMWVSGDDWVGTMAKRKVRNRTADQIIVKLVELGIVDKMGSDYRENGPSGA